MTTEVRPVRRTPPRGSVRTRAERHPRRIGIDKPLPAAWFDVADDAVAEMRWDAVDAGYVTPNDRFFVRNQSESVRVDPQTWRLRVDGPSVQRPLELTYDEILGASATSFVRAIECAGNGRVFFGETPRPPGTPWRLGGIGVAEWTGVPLAELLERARIRASAVDVVAIGLDPLRVRRPIPIDKAVAEDTLVAVAMNGDPLPVDHGFPARLIVPGWVGIASIKWLGHIRVFDQRVRTPWNTESYVLRGADHAAGGEPMTELGVNSAIELPWPANLLAGVRTVRGRSWSGHGHIASVEVSVDDGRSWRPATIVPPNLPCAWTRWRFTWDAPPGEHRLMVRATDSTGASQRDRVPWNDLGYGFDGIVAHPVHVHGERHSRTDADVEV